MVQAYRLEFEGGEAFQHKPRAVSNYAEDFHAMKEGTMGSSLAYEREGYDILHIRELICDEPIKGLRSGGIRHAHSEARKTGRFKETESRRIHVKLKQILNQAVDDDLIQRNPCRGIILPKANVEARQALSAEDAARFNSCLMNEPLSSCVLYAMLLLHCSLRKWGALGLSWADCDPVSRALRISSSIQATRSYVRLNRRRAGKSFRWAPLWRSSLNGRESCKESVWGITLCNKQKRRRSSAA